MKVLLIFLLALVVTCQGNPLLVGTETDSSWPVHYEFPLSASCNTLKVTPHEGTLTIYISAGSPDVSEDISSTTYYYSTLTSGDFFFGLYKITTLTVTNELVPGCLCTQSTLLDGPSQLYRCDSFAPPTYDCGNNNPCAPLIVPGKYYYPHADPTKYVQCSEWHGCDVMPCAPGTKWNDAIHTCGH